MEPKTPGTTKTYWKPSKIFLFWEKSVKFFRFTRIYDNRDPPSHIYCLNNMESKTPGMAGTTINCLKQPKISPFWADLLNSSKYTGAPMVFRSRSAGTGSYIPKCSLKCGGYHPGRHPTQHGCSCDL